MFKKHRDTIIKIVLPITDDYSYCLVLMIYNYNMDQPCPRPSVSSEPKYHHCYVSAIMILCSAVRTDSDSGVNPNSL